MYNNIFLILRSLLVYNNIIIDLHWTNLRWTIRQLSEIIKIINIFWICITSYCVVAWKLYFVFLSIIIYICSVQYYKMNFYVFHCCNLSFFSHVSVLLTCFYYKQTIPFYILYVNFFWFFALTSLFISITMLASRFLNI